MRIFLLTYGLILCTVLSATGHAASPAPSSLEACNSDPRGTSARWLAGCVSQLVPAQEERVATALAHLSKTLSSTARRRQLADTQRRWQSYRDAKCEMLISGEDGGTLQYLNAALCSLQETERRLAELEALAGAGLY